MAPKPDKKQFGGVRVLPAANVAPARTVSSSSSSSISQPSPEPAPRSQPISLEREYSIPPGSDEDEDPVLP